MANLAQMCKKMWTNRPLSRIYNFKTFRAEILTLFLLVTWKIDDFMNSFQLYLTFNFSKRGHLIALYSPAD